MSWLLLSALLGVSAAPVEADVVLKGGTLHDGSGKAAVVGDLAIKGDRIVAVGNFETKGKPRVIEAKGLILAPGFIDLHSHSDTPLQSKATRANLSFVY